MPLKEALKNEILNGRTLIYRRNAIGIGAVLIALSFIPCISYERPFGFRIEGLSDDIVKWLLCAGLLYNTLFFIYYLSRDYRPWIEECLEVSSHDSRRRVFPEVRMFFGLQPLKKATRHQASGGWQADQWKTRITSGGEYVWTPVVPKERQNRSGGQTSVQEWSLSKKIVYRFRERFLWFWCVDFGLPVVVVIAAFSFALLRPVEKPTNGCFTTLSTPAQQS